MKFMQLNVLKKLYDKLLSMRKYMMKIMFEKMQ